MTSSTITAVACPDCRHENEPERVYCHACGAKLDRSAVNKAQEDDMKDTQQRVKKLFDPHRAQLRVLFFKIGKLSLGACLVAGLVQMLLPPDVPAPMKSDILASRIRIDLENATSRHQATQLQFTQDQVNAFLVYALKTKQKTLDKPLLDFKRALVDFREGACAITTERSFFGYSVYTTASYAPTLTAGKIVASSRGGSIGRLPIHPQIAQFMDILFADVWSALDWEAKLVAKLGSIEFHDKSVVVTTAQK
jgi:hypothetical protein